MEYWEYSQCIADRDIATKKGEFYYPPSNNTRASLKDIIRKFNLATNPVTKSTYRDVIVNRLNDKRSNELDHCYLSCSE